MKTALLLVIFLYYQVEGVKIDPQELRCLVCKTTLDEISKVVNKIDPTKRVDVGGYRLDSEGNYVQKTVSQAKSEIHLSELMEDVCAKMDDYVRGTWKTNGTLMLLKLISEDGKMNELMSEVDLVQDEDLNKSLKYYCEGIIEELEDKIIEHFLKEIPDLHKKICTEESGICSKKRASNEEL